MPENDDIDPDATPTPSIDPAEHANLALENALLRAGVELDTPRGDMVRQAWEGRTPDLEAIKAHWDLVKPPEAPVEPLAEAEQRIDGEKDQAAERRDLVASSVVEPNPEDTDPVQAARQAGIDVLAPPSGGAAGTRDDAQAAVVHMLADAAGRGDARVLVHEQAV